jgi:hypothetical protein
MIGTAHEFQRDETLNHWREEFREMLRSVLAAHPTEIILEEWSQNLGQSIGQNLESADLKWHKISPAPTPEYRTEAPRIGREPGPNVPFYLSLTQYPFEPHERRESYMVQSITEAMEKRSGGLVIVGMNHVHSLMRKLREAGFEVIAGNWLQTCDKGQKIVQSCDPPGSSTPASQLSRRS